MKKFLTLVLVCCLVFSSSSGVYAVDWSNADSTNLSNAANRLTYNGFSAARLLYDIDSTLSTISSTVSTIASRLVYGDHSITYWVNAINTWMSPIYGRLADIISQGMNIEAVAGLLGSTDIVDGTTVRTPYLFYNSKSIANWASDIYNKLNYTGSVALFVAGSAGTSYNNRTDFSSPFQATKNQLEYINKAQVDIYTNEYQNYLNNALVSQSFTGWSDLESHSFTPSSGFNGLYTWLSKIQSPIARLSYVLASDERIEAQEKAADNEQAVVDNFIDSSGSGSASTSDFGSVSDLSSGFKNNISTDASVSGIWHIFNADNFGWFSQETADQLDTSGSGTKTLRSSGSYPTPLLDQQTEDIMKILGGNDND